MVVSGGILGQGRHAHAALCTGPVELHSHQQLDSAALQALVTELRNAVHAKGATRSWQATAEQASTIVWSLVTCLYIHIFLMNTTHDKRYSSCL